MVLEWPEGTASEEKIAEDIEALLREDPFWKGVRSGLGYDLRLIAREALESPEGGRGSEWSGIVRSSRRWGQTTTSLLGYAWKALGGTLHLGLAHEVQRVPDLGAPGGGTPLPLRRQELQRVMALAGKVLRRHLAQKGAELVPEEVRVGNLVFLGHLFEMGPRWVSPAEVPGLRVALEGAGWEEPLAWEDLARLGPRALSRRVTRAVPGGEDRAPALEGALAGRLPGAQALGVSVLKHL